MKHITQLVSSSVLLVLGFAVAALSLRGMHADAAFAASPGLQPPTHRSGLDFSAIVDNEMPGSLPYIASRGWERAETLWLTDIEKVQEFIVRLSERQESAEWALKAGKTELALTTYLKGYGYLHEIIHDCFGDEATVHCDAQLQEQIVQGGRNLEDSLQRFIDDSTDDALRARAEGLLSQLNALQQQFHLE